MERAAPAAGRAGFTLVEVLIAVTIVVILGAVVGLNVLDLPQKGRVGAARQQLETFKTALAMFAADNGFVPTAEQGLAALVAAPECPPLAPNYPPRGYLEKAAVPLDPWGREYAYLVPGPAGKPFDVVCYGADGEEGGDGWDADVSCWK